jgi:phosphoenolpyruvate carboxylase
MRTLHSSGRSVAEIERAMLELDVRPVLTAHPTESTRRTLLALQSRVAGQTAAQLGTCLLLCGEREEGRRLDPILSAARHLKSSTKAT